jgi:hypothetical protein
MGFRCQDATTTGLCGRTLERRVHRTGRHVSLQPLLHFLQNRPAVGFVFEAQDREENGLFRRRPARRPFVAYL